MKPEGRSRAERVGFEPTVRLPVLRFSRPALSSTQPSLLDNYFRVFRPLCQRTAHDCHGNRIGVPSPFIPAFARAGDEKTCFLCQILPFCAMPSFDKLRAARIPADGRGRRVGCDKASWDYVRDTPPGLARSRCHWVIQMR